MRASSALTASAMRCARERTRAEVARTLGEAYLRLSNSVTRDPVAKGKYLASAREVLEDARASGEADPPVFHQLGILAQEAGENDEAIAWLQRGHWLLLAAALVTIFGAVAGSHGGLF